MKPPNKVPCLRMVLERLPTGDARVRDRLGGEPNAWSDAEPWPSCGVCKQPLHFVVQLRGERHGGRAKIGRAAALQLFVCHTGSDCGFYELRSKSSHVALRRKPLRPVLAHRPGGIKSSVVDDPLRAARGITFKAASDDAAALDDDEIAGHDDAFAAGFTDKLYGVPVAANLPDDVRCKRCKKPMSFLGQLLSADDWFVYYLHACKSGHEVTFHAHRA